MLTTIQYVKQWKQWINRDKKYSPDELEELETFLLDKIEDLQETQKLSDKEAFLKALDIMGEQGMLTEEFSKVRRSKFDKVKLWAFLQTFLSLLLVVFIVVPNLITKQMEFNNFVIWTKNRDQWREVNSFLDHKYITLNDGFEYYKDETNTYSEELKMEIRTRCYRGLDSKTKLQKWEFITKADSLTDAVFDDSKIFFGTSQGIFYALNKKTGKEIWNYKAPKEIYCFNCIYNGSVIFRDYDSKLYSLDTETGNLKWTFSLDSIFKEDYRFNMGPVYSSGIIFFALNNNFLLGIDASNGKEKWRKTYDFTNQDLELKNGRIFTLENIKIKKNKVGSIFDKDFNFRPEIKPLTIEMFNFDKIVSNDNRFVVLKSFDVTTGNISWSEKIIEIDEKKISDQLVNVDVPNEDNSFGGSSRFYEVQYELPLVFASNLVFFNDRYIKLYGFDQPSGKKVIEIDLLKYKIPRKFYSSSMAIEGNVAYFFGSNQKAGSNIYYALDLNKNKLLWKKVLGDCKDPEHNDTEKRIYFKLNKKLITLDKQNGRVLYSISIPFDFNLNVISNDTLMIVREDSANFPYDYAYGIQLK